MSNTVSAAMRLAAQQLAQAGVESPAAEARLLMSYALASDPKDGHPRVPVSSTDLFMRGSDPAPAVFAGWMERRLERVPLQHIVGAASFAGLDFLASPAGFIPRPETELLVEWATQFSPATVVDVCSGPGTIALALASHLSTQPLRIIGLEKDPAAVQLARANEAQLRERGFIAESVEISFQLFDVRGPEQIAELGLSACADLVLSNPPYVPETALAEGLISPEVQQDPHQAVFGGADGMSLMGPLTDCLNQLAAPGARIAIEHDDATGAQVRSVLEARGMGEITQHRDLAGRERFVTATPRSRA